jgi:transcriptional antiterminator RfaH
VARDLAVTVEDCHFQLREGERWFVAQTLHQRQNLAGLHLAAQNFTTFLPRFRKTVRHARTLREVVAPLFPGYIFVGLDITRDRWRAINGTFGVARLLTAEGRPLPVPKGIVEALIAGLDDTGLTNFDGDLKPGRSVNVVAGPFVGSLGVLGRLDGKGRVRVLLTIMGGGVSVAMNSADVMVV